MRNLLTRLSFLAHTFTSSNRSQCWYHHPLCLPCDTCSGASIVKVVEGEGVSDSLIASSASCSLIPACSAFCSSISEKQKLKGLLTLRLALEASSFIVRRVSGTIEASSRHHHSSLLIEESLGGAAFRCTTINMCRRRWTFGCVRVVWPDWAMGSWIVWRTSTLCHLEHYCHCKPKQ